MLGKKKTGLIVLGLSALSLGTIGFSSWIISGISGNATSDVTVSVGEVKDQRIFMVLNSASDTTLNFDADKVATSGGVVSAGEDGEGEDLKISFSFNIYSNSRDIFNTAMSGKKLYLNFSSENENFKTAVNTNNYLLSPYAIDGADHAIDEGNEEANIDLTTQVGPKDTYYTEKSGLKKLTYTVTKYEEPSVNPQKYGSTVELTYYFAWGAMFNYENPVKLTSNNFANAETALKAIGNLHSQSLDLKIVASVK